MHAIGRLLLQCHWLELTYIDVSRDHTDLIPRNYVLEFKIPDMRSIAVASRMKPGNPNLRQHSRRQGGGIRDSRQMPLARGCVQWAVQQVKRKLKGFDMAGFRSVQNKSQVVRILNNNARFRSHDTVAREQ